MMANTASVVGIPSKTTWSSTATIKSPLGDLWLACGFSGDEQSPHDGRRFIKFLESKTLAQPADIHAALQEFLTEQRPETTLSLALAVKHQEHLYVFTLGFGVVVLVRGAKVRWLADGSQENVVLEGALQKDDVIILSTARGRELSLTEEALAQKEPDELVTQLFTRVQQHAHSGEIAFCFLKLREQAVEPIVPVQEEVAESLPVAEQPRSVNAPRHLIAPQKIEAAILASQEEHQKRARVALSTKDIFSRLQTLRQGKLRWWRAGAVALVALVLISGIVFYRAYSVSQEQLRVLAPLQKMAADLQNYPEDQKAQRRAAAQTLLERIKVTRVDYNSNKRALQALQAQVEQVYGEISGQKSLVNLPVFYDFRLVTSEILATHASHEKEQAVFLDGAKPMVLRLNLTTKKNETIPHEGLDHPEDVVLSSGTLYFLDGKSIKQLPASDSVASTFITTDAFQDATLMDSFADSLYILDRGAQQLWRLSTAKGATPSAWIRSARGIDMTKITSLAINGSVWLGSSEGNIYRLSRGEREAYEVHGLSEPFSSTVLLATTQEGEKLIVVEPKKQRLVVLSKDGEYLQQVTSEQIGAVTDVLLSDDEKNVYLVAGSVVYVVEIE